MASLSVAGGQSPPLFDDVEFAFDDVATMLMHLHPYGWAHYTGFPSTVCREQAAADGVPRQNCPASRPTAPGGWNRRTHEQDDPARTTSRPDPARTGTAIGRTPSRSGAWALMNACAEAFLARNQSRHDAIEDRVASG